MTAASSRGSMAPRPSEDYKALLRGEMSSAEYVRRMKANVDARRKPAPMLPGWRFYLGLGIFVGYAAGALTIGAFWWWGL